MAEILDVKPWQRREVLEDEDDDEYEDEVLYRTKESIKFWKSNARIKNVPGSVEMVAYSSPSAAFSPIWRTICFWSLFL